MFYRSLLPLLDLGLWLPQRLHKVFGYRPVLLALVLITIAAYVVHLGIEKPFLKLRDRLLNRNSEIQTAM